MYFPAAGCGKMNSPSPDVLTTDFRAVTSSVRTTSAPATGAPTASTTTPETADGAPGETVFFSTLTCPPAGHCVIERLFNVLGTCP